MSEKDPIPNLHLDDELGAAIPVPSDRTAPRAIAELIVRNNGGVWPAIMAVEAMTRELVAKGVEYGVRMAREDGDPWASLPSDPEVDNLRATYKLGGSKHAAVETLLHHIGRLEQHAQAVKEENGSLRLAKEQAELRATEAEVLVAEATKESI